MAERDVTGIAGVDKIRELIKGVRIAMLTTVAEDGSLHARPMATQEAAFDGSLWFITRIESPKVDEIRDDSHVIVTYEQPKDGTYLALQGKASIVRDREAIHKHWTPQAKAWFPQGENDPAVALIHVDVNGGEYWQANSSGLVRLGKLALGAVVGADKVDMNDQGKIRL